MPYFVYVLKSLSSGRSYIGSTNNLQNRLLRHNNNESKATKGKGPWELLYHEQYQTRSDAVKRERFFKSVEGRIELKNRGLL
ncbi:MAG TPA: GIY-YIG nuclease family protein [Nitrospirae bacterium]|nr:GIY-YIG nuclease family protein [Nitrospirota bacterium]